MVRLVFRPYTQIRRSICTSEPLRASTRVSSGFTLFRHSSPSFGSQQLCSYSDPSVNPRTGRRCTFDGSRLHSLSLRGRALHPNTRIDVRLLGPCFKTGRLEPLRQRPRYEPRTSAPSHRITPGVITLPEGSHVPEAFLRWAEPTLARRPTSAPDRSPDDRRTPWADAKRFPFNNFTYCFTLFSKYFSSFDHSTCLLSVSRQYLALDEIYHPF